MGPARLLTTAVALAAATTIAACGSSSPPRSSSSTGSRSSPTSSTLAFSRCMRANGVPTFPDISAGATRLLSTQGPNGQTVSVNGVSVNAPAFLTARQKCERYVLHQQGTPAQDAQQRQRGLEFAKCMRRRGVPNFPDPKVVSSHGDNQVVYLPGINPQSPAFEAAAKACGGGPKGP